MKRIDAHVGKLSVAMALLAAFFLLVIMALMVADILYRPAGNGSIKGAYEVVTLLLVLVVFLGLPYAERSETNVRVSMLTSALPRRVARVTRLIAGVVSFGVAAWFTKVTWVAALRSIERGEFTNGLVQFPIWPSRLAIALGFTVLAVECALGAWRRWQANGPQAEIAERAEELQYSAPEKGVTA